MNKKILTSIVSVALILSLTPTKANAADNTLNLIDVKENLEANGVNKDDINILIKKIENGEPWDNIIPGNKNYIEETEKINNTTITKQIYEDGSYKKITSIEFKFDKENLNSIPFNLTSRSSFSDLADYYGIEGGTTSSSQYHTTRTDCTVYADLGFAKHTFKASFTINQVDYNDYISDAYNGGGTVGFTGMSTTLVRNNESSTAPARAQCTAHPYWYPLGQSTLVLEVGSNTARVYAE